MGALSPLLQLALSFITVLVKDSGRADDAVKLLGAGLSAWRIGAAAKDQFDAVNAELLAMQAAEHQPTREEKDAKYNSILAAIDSVTPQGGFISLGMLAFLIVLCLFLPLLALAQDSTPMPDPVELAAKIGAVCAFVGFGLKAWPSISDEWSKQIIAVVGILAYVGLVHGWGDLDAWIGGMITSMAANGIVTTAAGVKRIASGEKVALVPKDQV